MTTHNSALESLSRRQFLRGAAASAAGMLLLPHTLFAQNAPSLYSYFRFGIQSYSLRNFKVDDALAKTHDLGVKWWEAFPGHFPLTDDPKVIDGYKALLKAHDIVMPTYGVVDFSNDEADARKKFNFAKAMGIATLTAYPKPDSLDLLDKLVDEYKINIAIHNHGPGDDLYDKWSKTLAVLEGHHARIGACIDTGHYLRSEEIPETAAGKFGKRVYGVHLKGVKKGANNDREFTELNTAGNLLDVRVFMKTLRNNGYKGIISMEYELHPEDPVPFIKQDLETVHKFLEGGFVNG